MALTDVKAAVTRLNTLLAGLDDATARAASGLPGWSRGHVITHIANFSEAMTRQVEEALQGRVVEMYDGGRPARDAGIEAGAHRPAVELTTHLERATTALVTAWDKVGPDDWTRPIQHRNSNLSAGLNATWRELAIHTVDLDLGITPTSWPPPSASTYSTSSAPAPPKQSTSSSTPTTPPPGKPAPAKPTSSPAPSPT